MAAHFLLVAHVVDKIIKEKYIYQPSQLEWYQKKNVTKGDLFQLKILRMDGEKEKEKTIHKHSGCKIWI